MLLSFTHSNTTIILTSNPIQKEDLREETYMENTVSQFSMAQKKRKNKGGREGRRETKKENY